MPYFIFVMLFFFRTKIISMNLLGDIFMLCVVVAVPMTEAVTLIKTVSLNENLTNMQVIKDKLYIGGKNKIYALDKDLNIVSSASTCDSTVPDCENINKVLLVNDTLGKLVSCGTGKGGICEVRCLNNLSYVEKLSTNDAYVSSDPKRPVASMLIGNGNFSIAVTYGNGLEQIEYSGLQTYKFAISTRRFSDLVYTKRLRHKIDKDYIIYYKKSFQHNGFSYFVTNQKKEFSNASSEYESKIVRICQNDKEYSSYTDIVITCENEYNLIQDVVLISKRGTPYIIGIFTQGEDPETASGKSVICGGRLDDIDDEIIETKKDYIENSCSDRDSTKRYLPNKDLRTNCTYPVSSNGRLDAILF